MRSSQVVDEIYPSGGWDLAELGMRSAWIVDAISPSWGWDLPELWMRSSRVMDEICPSCGWDLAEYQMRAIAEMWMRASRVLDECGWDLPEWLDGLTANSKVAKVLGSIPASSDTVESEGLADEAMVTKNYNKIPGKKCCKKLQRSIVVCA